jgi:hypothetical protein
MEQKSSVSRHLNMHVGPMDLSVVVAMEQERVHFKLMVANIGNVITATIKPACGLELFFMPPSCL